MVGGAHGVRDHVVRLAVMESNMLLGLVTIPHHHVEAHPVQAIVLVKRHAMKFVVMVRILV